MIKVKFFAMLKGKVGREEVNMDIPGGDITLGGLKELLKSEFPSISEFIDKKNVLFSVNEEFATHDTHIKDGDEVALLPPFSGG